MNGKSGRCKGAGRPAPCGNDLQPANNKSRTAPQSLPAHDRHPCRLLLGVIIDPGPASRVCPSSAVHQANRWHWAWGRKIHQHVSLHAVVPMPTAPPDTRHPADAALGCVGKRLLTAKPPAATPASGQRSAKDAGALAGARGLGGGVAMKNAPPARGRGGRCQRKRRLLRLGSGGRLRR